MSLEERERLRTILLAAKAKGNNLIGRDEFLDLGGRAEDW